MCKCVDVKMKALANVMISQLANEKYWLIS